MAPAICKDGSCVVRARPSRTAKRNQPVLRRLQCYAWLHSGFAAVRIAGLRRFALACGLAVLSGWGLPVVAQEVLPGSSLIEPIEERLPRSSETVCNIFTGERTNGKPASVFAGCQGRGLLLGRATGYEVVTNEALKAVIVDLRLESERRVWLISLQEDGNPLLEDVSGALALAAERGPMSSLGGVELDLASFGRDGGIGVRGLPEDKGSSRADRINFGEQLARERSRRRSIAGFTSSAGQ